MLHHLTQTAHVTVVESEDPFVLMAGWIATDGHTLRSEFDAQVPGQSIPEGSRHSSDSDSISIPSFELIRHRPSLKLDLLMRRNSINNAMSELVETGGCVKFLVSQPIRWIECYSQSKYQSTPQKYSPTDSLPFALHDYL